MKILLVGTLLVSNAFAAGDGHGSPGDLVFPAINFLILAGFFVWKLGPTFRNVFQKKHASVKENVERAKTLQFEAQMQLEQQEKKNANLEGTLRELREGAAREVTSFKSDMESETSERIEKLKTDADLKIENEKRMFLSKINDELINEIIVGAKSKIKSQDGLKNNIENKLIQGMK